MDRLQELASRVGALTGPCRETDCLIAASVRKHQTSVFGEPLGLPSRPRRYTASMDAALSLVPEGWVYGLESWPDPAGAHARAWLKQTSIARMGRREVWGHSSDDLFIEVTGATPALALTAACLKARALTYPEGDDRIARGEG